MRLTHKNLRIPAIGATCALAVFLMAGCDSHTDKLSDINNNPSGYQNKDVQIAGEVTKVYELPLGLSGIAAYRINDGTGQIWVLTHIGAPREGDKLGLKGRVQPEGKIGTFDLGSVIEEKERKMQ